MPDPIKVYNLGDIGVNVDSSPIGAEDPQIIQATNVVFDRRGNEGAYRKRSSITALNSGVLSGAVRGIVNVAKASPGSAGSGGGEGTPNGIYLAVTGPGVPTGIGWLYSVDGASFVTASPGPAQQLVQPFTPGVVGALGYEGAFVYAASVSSMAALVSFDGVSEKVLTFVNNEAGAPGFTYRDVISYNGLIYAAILTYLNATVKCIVVSIDPVTGAVTQQGNAFGTDSGDTGQTYVTKIGFFSGKLYACSWEGSFGAGGKVWSLHPGETTWSQVTQFTAPKGAGYTMVELNGYLYVGAGDVSGSGIGAAQKVYRITQDGTVTTSFTGPDTPGAADPVFFFGGGKLGTSIYMGYHYVNVGAGSLNVLLKKFDGTSWSTARNVGSVDYPGSGRHLQIASIITYGSLMYVLLACYETVGAITTGSPLVLATSNGSAFTNIAARDANYTDARGMAVLTGA